MNLIPSSSYAVVTGLDSSPDELMAKIASPASSEELEALTLLARRYRATSSDIRWRQAEALGLIFLDELESSLSLLEGLISPHDREVDTWVLRGMAYNKLNNTAQALLAYQKAIALDPERSDTLYNIGNILIDDNPAEAINLYSKSLLISPLYAKCWFNYGLACLNSGHPKRAIRRFGDLLDFVDQNHCIVNYT